MSMAEMRLENLETRIAELESREAANRAVLAAVARTVAQTDVRSVEDVIRKIENWEKFFEPIWAAKLPHDHSPNDVRAREAFKSTVRQFFEEVRKALPSNVA